MTLRTLIRRSLRFHRRSHLGVVLGAAIGSAALIGALVVGDSVKGSLRERSLERLGHGSWLLFSPDRFFREEFPMRVRCQANVMALTGAVNLYQKTSAQLPVCINPNLPERSMLLLNGTVTRRDASQRLNHVQIIGVPDFSPILFSAVETLQRTTPQRIALTNAAVVNTTLATKLGVKAGDEILLRFAKATQMSADTAVAPKDQSAATLRLIVHAVATNGEISNFSPVPEINPPASVFVPLSDLARAAGLQEIREANYSIVKDDHSIDVGEDTSPKIELRTEQIQINQVNVWLSPEVVQLQPVNRSQQNRIQVVMGRWIDWLRSQLRWKQKENDPQILSLPTHTQATVLNELLSKSWDFESAKIANLKTASNYISLTTPRVFIDSPVVRAAQLINSNSQPILTYLATLLHSGSNAAPYSMVTAAGAPWTPEGLRDDEIVVSQWLANDLRVKPGDEIALSYFLPESGAKLTEATNTFRVHSVVPMELPWADRSLMPDFPGIEKAESTRDWDAGFPLTYKIRDQDEKYWKQYRGTPKAFVTLAAGQMMWGNRFGNLTAIRFPIPTNATDSVDEFRAALEKKILANLKPEELGLRFEPVREQALKAAEESQDFGGLFLGFSFFVIAAALLLMAMLFQFGLEQRAPEIGTLLALGFSPKQVRNLFLREGLVLAFVGGVIGALGGIYFAKAMLHGLTTIWRDAVGATALSFHVSAQTLVIGLFASVVVCFITMWLALHRFVRRSPRELLAGEIENGESQASGLKSKVVAVAVLVGALVLVGWTLAWGDLANAGAFFGAGTLVLVAGLALANARLTSLSGVAKTNPKISLSSLAIRGCARRHKRSLATVAMLACGSFLIVSIGVFRLDANLDATMKTSGTGGFAFIGETTMPVVHDLNTQSGRDFFALNEQDLAGVNVVPFRVREGDEASCLNLNAAQKPKLLGVKPEMLEGRFAFANSEGWKALQENGRSKMEDRKNAERSISNQPSSILHPPSSSSEIPAVGDANSIQWAMHKKIGDTIDYVDERGQPFKVRIVGAVANSILQGQLIIDEADFLKRFPSESGYRMFLVDAPSNTAAQVLATLSRAMQDVGLELTPAAQRLNQFNAVQNTYLGTFQVLGGLGLLLGSVGLGIVVLRNVLERRGELAAMMALGFRKSQLQRLLLMENGALLLAGLTLGIIAATVAVLPALLSANGELPIKSLCITLGRVLVNGALWTWVATRFAVRGDLLKALRNE